MIYLSYLNQIHELDVIKRIFGEKILLLLMFRSIKRKSRDLSSLAVKNAINESKTKVIQKKIVDSKNDQKQLFKIVETLLGRTKEIVLPEYQDPASLASRFNMFFYG